MFHAEFLQTVSHGKVWGSVAVVIEIVDTDMAQAVELRTNTRPAVDQIVVIGGLGWTKRATGCLAGLNDCDGESSWWICGRVFIRFHREAISLACRDEFRGG